MTVRISLLIVALTSASAGAAVDFSREVRPILASKCFACHGPDDAARKAKLRLDVREGAVKPAKSDAVPIVPGKPEQSELFRRVTTADDDDVMPPPKHGARLTAGQVGTLKTWIAEGAVYSQHWSFVKPVRATPPEVSDKGWPKNEVDRFLLARRDKEG